MDKQFKISVINTEFSTDFDKKRSLVRLITKLKCPTKK